jgi:lysophospholipid acyltransferase (LPLAT)-like uncharacterized protein
VGQGACFRVCIHRLFKSSDAEMTSQDADTEQEERKAAPLSLTERIKMRLTSGVSYWIIRLIGRTLRWEVEGWEHHESIYAAGKRIIYAFWHGRIFLATYYFQKRGIVVMTSQNKDGEYIARVIRRYGYGAARGSSSRGSRRALVEMMHELRRNKDVAFTIDGPRGPRYIAKPGAAYLAWKTGHPVLPLNFAVRRKWILGSWDHFQIPKPFSPAFILIAPPIYVPPEATEVEIDLAHQQIQRSLDDLRERGDARWGARADR